MAQLKSIVEVISRINCAIVDVDFSLQDSLHREIEALVGVKHGEAIVQSLKEAAVTFLKRSKPLLLVAESAPPVDAAAESSGKRKRADESEDVQTKENPEDERNRRRVSDREMVEICMRLLC